MTMRLPFTADQFFGVFRECNTAVWPVRVVLLLMALSALVTTWLRRRWSGVAVSAILNILWSWLALGYHFAFFARINPAAYVFAGVSLLGAGLFLWFGVVLRQVQFTLGRSSRTGAGVVLVAFALVVYPVWATAAGHTYPELPTFGLPCPTTIFTVGVLAFSHGPRARILLIVPLLWSLVGSQAALLLDVKPDLGLLAAAAVAAALLFLPGPAPERK
jgi:hypothetical protein